MDDFDKIIAQANCIVNSDKTVDEMENMKLTIANLQGQLSSARSEGYVQALNDAIDSFCGERPYYSKTMIWDKLKQLRTAYLAGGKNDRQS